MAEQSDGSESDSWTCPNPECPCRLPNTNLSAMSYCPECKTKIKKVLRCMTCSVELNDPTHAIHHSKECRPKSPSTSDNFDSPSSPIPPPPQREESSTVSPQPACGSVQPAGDPNLKSHLEGGGGDKKHGSDGGQSHLEGGGEDKKHLSDGSQSHLEGGGGDKKHSSNKVSEGGSPGGASTTADEVKKSPSPESKDTRTPPLSEFKTPTQETMSATDQGTSDLGKGKDALVTGSQNDKSENEINTNSPGASAVPSVVPKLRLKEVFGNSGQQEPGKPDESNKDHPHQDDQSKLDQDRQKTHENGVRTQVETKRMQPPMRQDVEKDPLRNNPGTDNGGDRESGQRDGGESQGGGSNNSSGADPTKNGEDPLKGGVPYMKAVHAENLIDPKTKSGRSGGQAKSVGQAKGEGQESNANSATAHQKYDYKKHSGPTYDLEGLRAAPEKSIAITFHCIVPKLHWQWNDDSSIHLRFEGYALGDWKHNLGEFIEVQEHETDVCEMTCILTIDAELLKAPLGYKYVVYSPKMTKPYECYEKLHPFLRGSYDDPNRCLWISPQAYHRAYGGEFHRHDFFVYPGITRVPKSFVDQIKDTGKGVWNFLRWKKTQKDDALDIEMTILDKEAMVIKCLYFYLDLYRKTLLDGIRMKTFKIHIIVRLIADVFFQHYQPRLKRGDYPSRDTHITEMIKAMTGWLEETVAELSKVPRSQDQFIAAISIACCIVECQLPYNLKMKPFVVPLLKMLNIQPDIKERVEFLKDVVSRDFRATVVSAIVKLCKEAINSTTKEPVWDWLYVLPLYHFMNGDCEPFMKIAYTAKPISTSSVAKLELHKLKTKKQAGFVDEHYQSLEPLFVADPLLLYDFIYICQPGEYASLFSKIPTSLSLTWLSSLCHNMRPFVHENGEKWVKWLKLIKCKIEDERTEECELTVSAVQCLVVNLFGVLTEIRYSHFIDVLKMSLTVFLFCMAKVRPLVAQRKLEEDKITEAFGRCEQMMKDWIVHKCGSALGASRVLPKTELVLWKAILSLETPDDEEITERWNETMFAVIRKRVYDVPMNSMLKLVPLLDEVSHPILSSVLMEGSMQAIDNIASEPEKYASATANLAAFASIESEKVGFLLGHLLQRKYPDIEKGVNISLKDLLTWSHWPNFIKIYKRNSILKAGLPEPCQDACVCAVSKLDYVAKQLQTGEISILELQMIHNSQLEMKQLCEAAEETEEKPKQKAGYAKSMNLALNSRLTECKVFEKQSALLLKLCNEILDDVKGIMEARKELLKDYTSYNINTLCRRTQSEIEVVCFSEADSLLSFAWKFDVMTKQSSSLFNTTWHKVMHQARAENPNISIKEVEGQVWIPAFKHCQSLLDQLFDLSITLSDVDANFEHMYGTDLELELKALSCGVNMCLGKTSEHSQGWIRPCVMRIEEYRKLYGYTVAAESFLKLKESLKLTKGDFKDVERISAQVSSSMKDQTLADVNDELLEAGEFLSEFTSNKMTCIQQFCACQNIVQWIRQTTKDVGDLQNFVNVALATAGEGDFDNDRLSSLHTVGSGYSSLIYELKEDTGFKELCRRCTSIWTAYRNSPDLPKLLASCDENVEWYKSVKETQGSVEVTSFGQMGNIRGYGYYTIAGKRDVAMHSIHNVIQLTLYPPKEKEVRKTSYSLDELRDLESKLVLITGSKAENRGAVEHFSKTLHSVCRIAEELISLQQVGHTHYIGWRMEFYCGGDLVDDLQRQAKKMKEELETWNTTVSQARQEFYELNYYTTQQLLVLRRELGELKHPGHGMRLSQPTQVMALLESISNQLTPVTVANVVSQIVTQLAEGRKESNVQRSSIPTATHTVDAEVELPIGHVSPSPIDHFEDVLPTERDSGSIHGISEVSLSINMLNEKQYEHFTNVLAQFGFRERTALKAIEEVGDGDWNDVENWLMENANEFEQMFRESEGEDDAEEVVEEVPDEEDNEFDSDSDNHDKVPMREVLSVPSPSVAVGPSISHSQTKVVVTQRPPVDETNPEVTLLLDAEMGTTEQCIRAIEMYETAHLAMGHMMEMEAEDDGVLFSDGTLIPMLQERAMPIHLTRTDEIRISFGAVVDQYLELNEIGSLLRHLSHKFPAVVEKKRSFPSTLKSGQPHLLVVPPEQVLRAALSLYMEDSDLPMPTPEEMLICNHNTTTEEVSLLWQRAVYGMEFTRIFCLVHAEKLSYQTADKALRSLFEVIQGRSGYHLVIICSSQDEERSPIISKLHLYRRQYGVPTDPAQYRAYLRGHLVNEEQPYYQELQGVGSSSHLTASMVDFERSCVRVVLSTRAGMGKTLFITRMAEKLQSVTRDSGIITIPIHGPQVTSDSVMESLVKHQSTSHCTILHFDISPSVLWQVDTLLFALLIQRGLCDSQGRVWRNHSTQLYAVEVTQPESGEKQSIPERFTLAVLEILPSVNCVKPKYALLLMTRDILDGGVVVMDKDEFRSEAFQRVYQYLRRHTAKTNLDSFSYSKGSVEGSPHDCLQIILSYCGIRDPSWAEIRHFVNFLDLQLQSCERSYFCNEEFVGDVMAGLKSFVVKFMMRMSRDFSTSSLKGEVAKENEEGGQIGGDILGQYQIVERKKWEQSPHPYIFFNQDRISITFVGFMVTRNGDLIDPTHSGGVLERGIMTQQLYTGLQAQRVNFNDDYRQWAKDVMIQKISIVMGLEWGYDPDPTYVLTVDNLIKILAIQMRFRCGIPVVLMGETGCGKTRLIRFMCDLIAQGTGRGNMLILKVHGGTSEKDIETFLQRAEAQAKENCTKNLDTVVFFDEANTTEAIGLIKEIMCDRRLHGRLISQDLKFIAACNPYRRHTSKMIEKLRSAGLGFYVRESDTRQKLGKVPLRELVYRVIDLPPSMRPLVYDFGQLNTDTEGDYTRQIVHDHLKKHARLSQQHSGVVPAVARVLAWSQKYMRKRNDECSFVSLRDVERAMLVFTYFFDKMDLLRNAINEKQKKAEGTTAPVGPLPQTGTSPMLIPVAVPPPTAAMDLARSLILTVSVCYHARLSDRREFEDQIVLEFTPPVALSRGAVQFRDEIKWCQEVLLESMVLGENIAHNAALRENVFMVSVCVDLRIPLFLVGKPGSSKSLAKSIVADSMRGQQASQNDLLKSFKQVHMFSYQCSQLSTPQSVIDVFHTAKSFQKKRDTTQFVSVVVLDEVGLAEDSPNLPLKALHPLLEDGTEGADDTDKIVERENRVAFIGISNWALDPAKMNRGVMVTRGDPDVKELVISAEGICHNKKDSIVKQKLSRYFPLLAKAYNNICENQTRQFFGLRDFYSLIKMLYWMCEKTKKPPYGPQLVHAIRRNFGGLRELDPEKMFRKQLPSDIDEPPDLTNIDPDLHSFVSPDNTPRGLIKTSLRTKETSWHGENRYLLFLTENYAALEILKQYLQDREGDPLFNRSNPEEASLKPWEMEPFVLFGSSFPRDKEYTQVCRNINQIKICMEIGRTVILLNLENLYESLYDVLNQYYIHHGGNRYVDLGLQTHRVKCRVHDEFKLILIAEKTTVYEEFPTPLINRLEKHFVLYSSVLEEWQTEVLHELEDWIKAFSDVKSSNARFKEKDAFVGYQKDVAASVVFQASSQLRRACDRLRKPIEYFTGRHHLWQSAWEHGLLGKGPLEEVAHQKEGSDTWKEAVFLISQFLLLQTTPPSALVRLKKSSLISQYHRLNQLYRTQHHSSIDDFLNYHLSHESDDTSRGGLLLQVTTHSHLLSSDEVDRLKDLLEFDGLHSFLLQEFDTELDFTSKVSPLFVRSEVSQAATLLIIQCDSGHLNGDLIACARYRIYDVRAKALLNKYQITHTTHVLFIIHLPVQTVQSSFVGFQGDPWISCHIDELRPSEKGAITLEGAQGVPMSILFYGGLEEDETKAPELEEQTPDFTSNVEGMVFERMRSAEGEEEMEDMEEEEREAGRDERVVEGDMEVMDLETEEGTENSTSSKESSTSSQMEEPMEGEGLRNDITEREEPVEISPPVSDSGRELQPVSEMYTQCVRLNSCIQAAASRLQNYTQNKERAAERVKLLIELIPRKPVFPLEPHSFYAILVSHIHRVLKEREEVYKDRDDWIIQEAMNINHLQTGGTFKNVLARRLDEVIVPCFAMIIAFMDQNCNLNLLQSVQHLSPLSKFWLNICASQHAQDELRYVDMVGTQKVVMKDDNFACEFPFYWLVKDLMDCQWDSAQSTGGPNQRQIHRQLCALVSDSALGEILKSVQDGTHCEELFRRYTHDFVHSVHKCTHKTEQTLQSEYQLIQDCVHRMVVTGDDFTSLDGHVTLVDRIAAVHVVYRANSEYIHWFGQLTSHNPGILPGLVQSVKQTVGQDKDIMLHLYAVEKVLNGLKPPIEAKRESQFSDDQSLKTWLNRLREISYAIESTLSLPSQHPLAIKARLQWQKIRAIQMFTEHVLLNHGNMITYAKRLNLILGAETDFLKCSTVKKVQVSLTNMHGQLKEKFKSKDARQNLMAIRNSCRNFFIEVVSGLCFGQLSPPEDELVAMLLDIVFTEQGEKGEGEAGGEGEEVRRGTRDLTPYKEKKDENPIIRSFLLQLLLEHDTGAVKAHLRTYFDRCQQTRVGRVEVDHELCLLCTQCFEDALDKEYSSLSLGQKMENIWRKQLLSSATDILTNFTGSSQGIISLEVLEAVAKMRYALLVVAELLQLQVNEQGAAFKGHNLYGRAASALLEEARRACTEPNINIIDNTGKTDTTGPIVYLLKLLVRGAGFSYLKKIVMRRGSQMGWLVPQQLGRDDDEEKNVDPFVMYNPAYGSIREEMCAAAYGRDYTELEQRTAALQPQECVSLLLSVYEVYTMSRASTQMSKQLLPEPIEKMNEMIINCKTLPREMKIMARTLVSNEQGGPLAALQVSAGQPGHHRTLSAVVIHAVACLLARGNIDLLCPLTTLLTKPGDMARAYLPTMSEDMLPEVRRIINEGGKFYECPNGHAYFVGECGRPVVQVICPTCGSAIGGQNHVRVANNRDARSTDITQTGHSLGHPDARGDGLVPERSLSPAACCIVRAIMHSALVWISCNNDAETEGLIALVKNGLRTPQELPEFFWGHLERDVQLLARALGKNHEEAAIVLHLVLQNILICNPPTQQGGIVIRTLGTREVRIEWEKQFGQIYIHPILANVEASLGKAMESIMKDDKQDHDPLFYLVYERMGEVVEGSLEPHLWGYRPRITLEHLTRYMQQQKKKFPILKEFLKRETVLRATQYLPDIVQLQRRMFEVFHHRIDHKVARDKTMRNFIEKRHSENVRSEYGRMMDSVQRAWRLVRDQLKGHAAQFGWRIEEEWLQSPLNLDTTLDFFIPTTTGHGACTFALVHYLTYVHNEFIDWCRVKSKTSSWREHKIELPHVHQCHLLNYESQLQSLLLSHCRYSLKIGHAHEISYDLPALEKYILDRFIHGKPKILVDIPQVSYQKDVYTAATFAAVRKKVAPQTSLGARVQMDILRELGPPDRLRKSLDVVEIVLGFLTSGGGKAKTSLKSYLKKLKMDRKPFSEKAKEHCTLGHVLSLWQTLSVGLARVITLSGQEPFHTLNSELLLELSKSQCKELDKSLPKFDLDYLLGILYEFIETYIRHVDMKNKEWGLLDTLPPHLENSNLTPPEELAELPTDITLAQTVATWKYIVHFQAKQRQN